MDSIAAMLLMTLKMKTNLFTRKVDRHIQIVFYVDISKKGKTFLIT